MVLLTPRAMTSIDPTECRLLSYTPSILPCRPLVASILNVENGLLTNSVLGRIIRVCVTFMCRCTLLESLPGHVPLNLLSLTVLTVRSVV